MASQIFAMGGGGFSMCDDPALDAHFFGLSDKKRPRVCFIGTASGDSEGYVEKFYTAMKRHSVEATHLSLFRPPTLDLESFVLEQDVIYVGGGNTKNLIALWQLWQLDEVLRRALEEDVVLGGLSAGAICWFEEGVTDSETPPDSGLFNAMSCLGILAGSCCPHFDGEETRRPEYHRLVSEGMSAGFAIDDDCALHFVDGVLHEVVSARAGATAYRVAADGETVCEVDREL